MDTDSVRVALRLEVGFAGGHRALLDLLPGTDRPRASVLVLQPFAEEANFARRTLVAQARRLARAGFRVQLLDLLGTGDSAGEFTDASVDAWLDDVELAARRLRERDRAPLVLWGARFGALLARHAAARIRPDLVVEWDALRDGRGMLSQFRRLARLSRLTAAPRAPGADTEDVPGRDAGALRIAGYTITPELAAGIEALDGASTGMPCPVMSLKSPAAYWQEQAPADLSALHEGTDAALHAHFPLAASRDADGIAENDVGALPAPAPAPAVPEGIAAGPEQALSIDASGRILRAILHLPDGPARTGLIIVPGRPQTRVGSHRMFVQLARACRARGIATLRFDHAGFGDSDGAPLPFDADTHDLQAVIRAFRAAVPGCGRVVLWGLCDGATSAFLAAGRTKDVDALIGLNPWVHDRTVRARSMLRSHYRQRLLDPAFWRRLARGQVRVGPAVREAIGHVVQSLRPVAAPAAPSPRSAARRQDASAVHVGSADAAHRPHADATDAAPPGRASLPEAVRTALDTAALPTCLLLSGQDMTAAEVSDLLATRRWRRLRRRLQVRRIPDGDHTLSVPGTMEQAIGATIAFLEPLPVGQAPDGTAS